MDNKEILTIFRQISTYCDSIGCKHCIIRDICDYLYDEIGIPHDWVKTIEERIKRIE